MTDKELAFAYLNQDPILHVSMLEPLRHGLAQVAAVSDRGVILKFGREAEDAIWMVAAADTDEALRLLKGMPFFHTWNIITEALARDLAEIYHLKINCPCHQAVYTSQERLPVTADIRQLDMSYLDIVARSYSLFYDPDYVADRIRAGVMYGAFVDGKLAAFVGEHSEGSQGMLEVFPEYRRRGLGIQLASFQINRVLDQGRVPFDQVVLGNESSTKLQQKLGMVFSKDTISWAHPDNDQAQTPLPPTGLPTY